MTKNNTPALRFDGFDGEWVPRTLRNCGEYSKGSGYSKKDITDEGTPVIHYGRLYTNYETAITNIDTFASPQPGSVISRGDEVLVPASGETAEDIVVASALLQPGVLIGGDLNVIRPNPGINPIFLALGLSSGAARDTLVKRAQGKSVVHLRNSDIQEAEVSFPSVEEQRTIGELFADLDALIEQHRAKHANLQQTKTALMQRMFPQDGADEPELRLGGFSEAWVSLPLGDLGTPISGAGFPHSEQGGETGTPFFKVSDMSRSANERELLFAANYVSVEQIRKRGWQVINGPAVVFAKVGAAVLLDRKRLVRGSFLEDNNMMAFVLSQTALTPDFALSLFETLSLSSLVQVGALPSINGSQVKAMQVSIPPTLEEQRAIGEVFSNLDVLIAAEANYITQLTQAKTALLQRMFV